VFYWDVDPSTGSKIVFLNNCSFDREKIQKCDIYEYPKENKIDFDTIDFIEEVTKYEK
jgi:hypothetical protein